MNQSDEQRPAQEPAELSSPGMWPSASVFAVFLKLGLTSFGGPTAHIGYFREEFVSRRRWIDSRRFAELLALCQFLPGPASSQLGFALGLDRAGYRGAIAAWVAFTMPSALLMVLFATGAVWFGGPIGGGVILGLEAVAAAVVAHAVWSLARTLTPDAKRVLIAIGAAALALLLGGSLGQLAAIGIGVMAGLAFCRTRGPENAPRSPLISHVSIRAGVICLSILALLLIGMPLLAATTGWQLAQLADAFIRSGALVFGTGHAMLPLLAAEPAISAAVSQEQFLAGYGAVQAMPGPLFTFAAYLGAIASPGSPLLTVLVALVAVFLPGMLLIVGVLPFWNKLRSLPGAAAGIRGANAAVVGILAAAFINPIALTAIVGWIPLALALVALALLALRVAPWLIVLLGAGLGAAAGAAGVPLTW